MKDKDFVHEYEVLLFESLWKGELGPLNELFIRVRESERGVSSPTRLHGH